MTLPKSPRRTVAPSLSLIAGAALLLAACGGSDTPSTPTPTPTPTPEYRTETFNGTLAVGGSAYHTFSTATQGTLTGTLTSLSPQATASMGFGFGTVQNGTCSLFSNAYSNAARVGFVLSGTIGVGSYCIALYDVGNLASPNDYVITVVHP
jgi:hypothetical protein